MQAGPSVSSGWESLADVQVRKGRGLIEVERGGRSRARWELVSIEVAGYTGYRITASAGVSCICLFFSSIHPQPAFFRQTSTSHNPHRTPHQRFIASDKLAPVPSQLQQQKLHCTKKAVTRAHRLHAVSLPRTAYLSTTYAYRFVYAQTALN